MSAKVPCLRAHTHCDPGRTRTHHQLYSQTINPVPQHSTLRNYVRVDLKVLHWHCKLIHGESENLRNAFTEKNNVAPTRIRCSANKPLAFSSKGYYNYGKPGGRVPQRDSEVEQLILDFSQKHGIKRRQIHAQEIIERCMYPLINEGFRILEEGIARTMEEIDIIWLYGYGWPRHTGGPMYYAKQVGLQRVYERILHYQEQFPYSRHWYPADFLKKMVTQPSHKL